MMTLVSCRELNNNRKSHDDRNDNLNMSLLKETCCAHRVQFPSSTHFSKFVILGENWGWGMIFHRFKKTIRQTHHQRMKVPFHCTTSTGTPRRDEDPELFIVLLRYTSNAACSLSNFLRIAYALWWYNASRTACRVTGQLACRPPPCVKVRARASRWTKVE